MKGTYEGDLLELGISAWGSKLELWGYRAEKDVWWYLQPLRTWRTRRTDGRTPADSKDCANAWRRTVKTTFALYPAMVSFHSEYGWVECWLRVWHSIYQAKPDYLFQRIAKQILSNARGGARAHVPTSWRRHWAQHCYNGDVSFLWETWKFEPL